MHVHFARIYDEFMKDVNYNSWYKFLREFIKTPSTLLDLGCGTGNISKLFSESGFDVIGVDISSDMIEVAKTKDKKTNYVVDDMLEYRNEKVDYIMCNFDTINYLSSFKDLERFFINVYNNLNNGGIFVFDIVKEEIFEEIFQDDLFVDTTENYSCIWYHEKLKETKDYSKHLVSMEIFYKLPNGLYEKIEEVTKKTIFNLDKVISLLKKIGFVIHDTAINGEYGEGRVFFILKKDENIVIAK